MELAVLSIVNRGSGLCMMHPRRFKRRENKYCHWESNDKLFIIIQSTYVLAVTDIGSAIASRGVVSPYCRFLFPYKRSKKKRTRFRQLLAFFLNHRQIHTHPQASMNTDLGSLRSRSRNGKSNTALLYQRSSKFPVTHRKVPSRCQWMNGCSLSAPNGWSFPIIIIGSDDWSTGQAVEASERNGRANSQLPNPNKARLGDDRSRPGIKQGWNQESVDRPWCWQVTTNHVGFI